MSVKYFIPNQINISNEAKKHFLKQSKNNYILIDFKKSGCSGYRYHISNIDDNKITDDQIVYFFDPLYIVIEKDKQEYFKGVSIDYIQKGLNSELEFNNPNTSDECGCGESFSLK